MTILMCIWEVNRVSLVFDLNVSTLEDYLPVRVQCHGIAQY